MKEATGELTTTVIVVAAIGLVAVAFSTVFLPLIKVSIAKNSCATECGGVDNIANKPTRANVNNYVCDCN